MMYDPKTGKGYKADTYADHVRMDKMGYVHDKPEIVDDMIDTAGTITKAAEVILDKGAKTVRDIIYN